MLPYSTVISCQLFSCQFNCCLSFLTSGQKVPELVEGPSRRLASFLVSKMSKTGKHHADAVFVAAVDGFLVAHRAARLHNGSDACFMGQLNAVLEGEEGIGGQNSSLEVEVERTGFLDGLAQGIHARSLPDARGKELLAFG